MKTPKVNISEALTWLRSFGVDELRIQFSGGNDEGGVNDSIAVDSDGNEVNLPSTNGAYFSQKWDKSTQTYSEPKWLIGWGDNTRDVTPEEQDIALFWAALEDPIYDEYGSFAGEFYVNGTLTWFAQTGKHEIHGTYEYTVSEEF